MSQSIDDRLGDLLKLYISGSCNYEEYQELLALLKVQNDSSHIEELLLEEVLGSTYHEAELQVNWQQMVQSVLQHQEAAIPAPVRKMALGKRIAVAAVVFITLGAIAYWWLQKGNDRHTNTSAMPLAADVEPGRNGAVLTLHNGQTVLLDSTRNGAMHLQPGLQVAKQDSLISYSAGSTPVKEDLSFNTLTTPRGRKFQLLLSDGTKVWLNASSSIHYPAVFTGRERVVDVTGEVYFEVAKNAARPFIVNMLSSQEGRSKGRVEVLGTHFNINAYDDEGSSKVTLLEGRVKVGNRSRAQPGAIGNESVILKPGEQAVAVASPLTTHYSPLTINHSPDLDQVMAWKNGYFQFERADIQTVMRQLARWYDVDVQYEGTITKDRFGGSIPREATLSQVLHALEQSQVHFTIQGKKVIVTP